MFLHKNYTKYYRQTYLKNRYRDKNKKLNILILFSTISIVFFMFIFTIFTFYILVSKDHLEHDESENLQVRQTLSIKKKNLRTDFFNWNKNCDWNLIVVNENNSLPEFFVPKLSQYGEIKIDERIISELSELIHEASTDNILLWVSCAYRSKEHQEQLLNREVEAKIKDGYDKNTAINIAKRLVPTPDCSEHCTGLAIDFNAANDDFYSTKEYAWLVDNCTRYGFVLRYPKDKEQITGRPFEPGHFRYVGEENAAFMKSQDLCLEEYISTLIK